MPFFRVMLHGSGIRIPDEEGTSPIVGFYKTCAVHASGPNDASEKAERLVHAQWTGEPLATANHGQRPTLEMESIEAISFWQWTRISNRGHTFYPDAPNDA